MTTTTKLQDRTPLSIDTELAALYVEKRQLAERRDVRLGEAHRLAGDKQTGYGRSRRWGITDDEAIEQTRARAEAGGYENRSAVTCIEFIDKADTRIEEINEQTFVLNTEYVRRGRWSRFFLVDNTGGHIHSSMHCSTCNRNGRATSFSWLPDLSGRTEAEAVEAHGAKLCTVCYPSAPVEWTNFWEAEEARKLAESCPGSGTSNWDKDGKFRLRFGYASGNGGTCAACGGYAAATSSRKIRKHKPGAE